MVGYFFLLVAKSFNFKVSASRKNSPHFHHNLSVPNSLPSLCKAFSFNDCFSLPSGQPRHCYLLCYKLVCLSWSKISNGKCPFLAQAELISPRGLTDLEGKPVLSLYRPSLVVGPPINAFLEKRGTSEVFTRKACVSRHQGTCVSVIGGRDR